MNPITLPVTVELREAEGGPRLHATIIQEGRAARGGRAELFAPGAVTWPPDGIKIVTRHLGPAEVRAMPRRGADGAITVEAQATAGIVTAIRNGATGMSVEFYPIREVRTAAGVREIEAAYVDGACLTDNPEYSQTSAELRQRRRVATWL